MTIDAETAEELRWEIKAQDALPERALSGSGKPVDREG
jgi:hypothetical protein